MHFKKHNSLSNLPSEFSRILSVKTLCPFKKVVIFLTIYYICNESLKSVVALLKAGSFESTTENDAYNLHC